VIGQSVIEGDEKGKDLSSDPRFRRQERKEKLRGAWGKCSRRDEGSGGRLKSTVYHAVREEERGQTKWGGGKKSLSAKRSFERRRK